MASTDNLKMLLDNGSGAVDATRAVSKVVSEIKRYKERVRKHIEENYVNFIPNHSTAENYLSDAETLVREAEQLLQNVDSDVNTALRQTNADLEAYVEDLHETLLGLRVTNRILKIDDMFQCVEEGNATKEYLLVLDLLSKLKGLIYGEGDNDVDRLLQKCECFHKIKVKFLIQNDILVQNLLQRFEMLVQLNEKRFPNAKCITLQVSKDVGQVQDTVMALFQARYNPIKICDFLFENCFEPLILKPVSVECTENNPEYVQLKLSYSLKDGKTSLRPSYIQVFEHIKLLLHCLGSINVSVAPDQHVFSIIGDHIKERLLPLIVNECLMYAVPETMDELHESTLVGDVLEFETLLDNAFLINNETDCALREFTEQFETFFRHRFFQKVLDSAKEIVNKDLQDMTLIAEKNTPEDVANNPFLFPCCMISKSTLELVKLMERILRQMDKSEGQGDDSNLNIITEILNFYWSEVPKVHEMLLESIPQQSVLFYNNCMFLAHWIAKNSEQGTPNFPALVKSLQATGLKYLNVQIAYQKKIIMDILKGFDLSDAHSLGSTPLRLIRQCLRQLDLLKNVWQSVLPYNLYTKIFCELLNDLCGELIRRVLAMEDISATLATELSELIKVVLDKAPTLFKEPHEVVHIKMWMKLQQLQTLLNASLCEITELWCNGAGILTANYKADEVKHMIRALFQNTDRRAIALTKII